MVNAQEWLDKEYPKEERSEVTELNIGTKDEDNSNGIEEILEGSLSLIGFFNLKELRCDKQKLTNLDLTDCAKLKLLECESNELISLDINNCSQLLFLVCDTNQLTNLDLTRLDKLETLCCLKNEISNLDISKCPNLTYLRCDLNQISKLVLPNPSDLEELHCWGNLLTELDFSVLDSKKLTDLGLGDNNFSAKDLSCFSRFINLKTLCIGNWNEENIKRGVYNSFHGSLKPLKNSSELKILDISNTDLNDGAEYLPASLETIHYETKDIPTCKLVEVKEQLDLFTKERENWKQLGFTWEEARNWIKIGLKTNEYEFANFLKNGKDLTFLEVGNNLEELREEYHQVQTWLNWNYPQIERANIKELNISNQNLWGDCSLQDFSSLNKLSCLNNELTSLDLSQCKNLVELNCAKNSLIDLDTGYCSNLIKLDCSNNKLSELELSVNNELTSINCSNNQLFTLDLTNNTNLTELFCSNKKPNHEKLTNIIFSPDFESFKLERINLTGNDKLDYIAIDKRFLKRLPDKLNYEIPVIATLGFEQIIRARIDIPGEIKDIHFFSTWWNPNCALVTNKVVWYGVRLVVYELPNWRKTIAPKAWEIITRAVNNLEEELEVLKVIKVSEHIYKDKVRKKIEELKIQLNSDSPVLAIYSHDFSPSEAIERIELPKDAKYFPEQYLRPTDIVWRNMKIPILGCYHIAVYLGNKRVVHIGSSKFIKTSKVKESKALLGARNDHWLDFLSGADESKLIRYRSVIPFQRPEKIQERITNAILSEYGQKEYNFLGHNCEHFATLCVCGIPFSTQADKIELLFEKIYFDLAQELTQTEQKFAKMTNSKIFKENLKKLKLKEIKNLSQKELTTSDQEKLASLETEVEQLKKELINIISKEIKELANQDNLSKEEENKLISLTKDLSELKEEEENDSDSEITSSIHSNTSTTSLISENLDWKQIIEKKSHISGTIVEITPLDNPNQALVINKVVLYAVRLFEYKDNKLKKLKRYAKNKVGYTTLEVAQDKVRRIIEIEKAKQTTAYLEIPPK